MCSTLYSLHLFFPVSTVKPMLESCKLVMVEKGDTVPCQAQLLSYSQEKPAQGLGVWDLITVAAGVFHILKSQESSSLLLHCYPAFTHIVELFSKRRQRCERAFIKCFCLVVQQRFAASFQRLKNLTVLFPPPPNSSNVDSTNLGQWQ